MRRFIWATTYAAGGLAAGCLSAYLMIQNAGVEPVSPGSPWHSRPAALSGPQAFYARAHYMLEGRLPPAPGQMIEATAMADSEGRPLSAGCVYRLEARGPLPGWWSLAAAAGSSRHATAGSGDVMRGGDMSVSITASRLPAPGNWLRLPERGEVMLIYTAFLQDTGEPPFSILREGCP
jgi:hypothetical protein